ncbi:hypothetical protein [Actinotalea sp. K2]|uniref:hypothetical protein n=1 Tax=Actinotalea sp. K2 TaxID=2939438 RepID=UPI00201749E3|nr:hypothetical protein [Actinotalea sp. K2]MCL3861741.1 hypothetical protein [Actinotalea sp. K2]
MSNRRARVVRSGAGADRVGLGSTAVQPREAPMCDIVSWLAAYEPRGSSWRSTPSEPRGFEGWEGVSAFVRDMVGRYVEAHGPVSVFTARVLTRTVVELVLFAAEQGTTISASAVLTHWTVQQFDEALTAALRARLKNLSAGDRRLADAAGRSSVASQVGSARRVAQALNPRGGWPMASERRHRYFSLPYCLTELGLLEDQIARNAGLARRNGEAFLVLGLGAGLDGRWSARVSPEHVQDLGADGLVVQVPGRAVPVLHAYEARLRALVAQTPEGGLLFGGTATHKGAASDAVARVRVDPGGPQLELGRLRSTWIVTHLTMGTRVPELMAAAGLESMTPISDMAEFVPPLDPSPARCVAAARAMLRGAGVVTR